LDVIGIENSPSRDDAQACRARRVRLDLLRDLLHEALGFAKLYGNVARMLAEVGEPAGIGRALGNFHHAAATACMAGRDIRDLRNGRRR
jgi:hypothetical protein